MISVLDHIEYLSAEHDCVIVPGFGAFISQYSFQKSDSGLISSLRRNTVFNMSVNNNDGLLANSLVRREGISYEAAKNEIDIYVSSLRSQLKHEGEVPVGRIGFLKYHTDESLEFFPFSSWNANNEYYGLSSLSIKPLVEERQMSQSVDGNGKILPFAKRFIHIAASIVLLVCLTLVLSTPVLEQSNQNYANLNAFTLKSSVGQETRDLFISIPKIKQPQAETAAVKANEKETACFTAKNISDKGKFCLVVASLATQKQAEKYIEENNLTDCEIMKSKSKYRVYIARGTFKEMCNLKTNMYSQSDAWVCSM